MPYKWTPPDILVEYDGVTVYLTYNSDDYQNPTNYHFTLDPDYRENGESECFDVRGLSTWATATGPTEDQRIINAVCAAIEKDELRPNTRTFDVCFILRLTTVVPATPDAEADRQAAIHKAWSEGLPERARTDTPKGYVDFAEEL